jgi:hypothetical protein
VIGSFPLRSNNVRSTLLPVTAHRLRGVLLGSLPSHGRGRRFDPCIAHNSIILILFGYFGCPVCPSGSNEQNHRRTRALDSWEIRGQRSRAVLLQRGCCPASGRTTGDAAAGRPLRRSPRTRSSAFTETLPGWTPDSAPDCCGASNGAGVIRIAISVAAFQAIASTLPLGSVGYEAGTDERGEPLIWLDRKVVDRLGQMPGPGESYGDVILRLAGETPRQRAPDIGRGC